jgi:murein DD-endopeptidase MepM/ murein hydrolase activator NlpD
MSSLRGTRRRIRATAHAGHRSGAGAALTLGAAALVAGPLALGAAAPGWADDGALDADLALVAALEGLAPKPSLYPSPALVTPKPTPADPAATAAAEGADKATAAPRIAVDADAAEANKAFGQSLLHLAALADIGIDAGAALERSLYDKGPQAPVTLEARVESGDTLMGMLLEAGVDRMTAHKAIKAMEPVFDPRHMRPGHVVNIRFNPDERHHPDDTLDFVGFDFEPSAGVRVVVLPSEEAEYGFRADKQKATLDRELVRFGGPINSSLYQAAIEAGVSDGALGDMIHILSYDIDFQRDIRVGDSFEIMYERFNTPDGDHVRDGRVLFAALTNGGRRLTAYAFKTDDDHWDYFDENGHGVRKPLMRTPIDGARLSSSYGMRRHPVLGYSRMHSGVDFAAPTGTPIFAAGDGVVNYAGRKGGYGNYIQIRHNGEFSTAYAHLSRLHVRNGERVKQGEVIGRVGSTGMSTGPHLHYEIIRNGKKVNPMGVRFQPAVRLAGAQLDRFEQSRHEIETLYASLREATEIASTAATSAPDAIASDDQAAMALDVVPTAAGNP